MARPAAEGSCVTRPTSDESGAVSATRSIAASRLGSAGTLMADQSAGSDAKHAGKRPAVCGGAGPSRGRRPPFGGRQLQMLGVDEAVGGQSPPSVAPASSMGGGSKPSIARNTMRFSFGLSGSSSVSTTMISPARNSL